eukprot:Gregarina_sp_Poly_1__10148@NODE_694_length_6726_cov_13_942184_g524_i0_p7_GENE_NODE_694_length_6726_cov_13_942184_g524_i0NODE_694_length_6726_cov_13_942184_g524_i0_p7_ORF_typecomplete_len113_score2_34CopD/PF05425_13/0_13_NODE_694_length_6726_cov_13_942184_g524_i035043842
MLCRMTFLLWDVACAAVILGAATHHRRHLLKHTTRIRELISIKEETPPSRTKVSKARRLRNSIISRKNTIRGARTQWCRHVDFLLHIFKNLQSFQTMPQLYIKITISYWLLN